MLLATRNLHYFLALEPLDEHWKPYEIMSAQKLFLQATHRALFRHRIQPCRLAQCAHPFCRYQVVPSRRCQKRTLRNNWYYDVIIINSEVHWPLPPSVKTRVKVSPASAWTTFSFCPSVSIGSMALNFVISGQTGCPHYPQWVSGRTTPLHCRIW